MNNDIRESLARLTQIPPTEPGRCQRRIDDAARGALQRIESRSGTSTAPR